MTTRFIGRTPAAAYVGIHPKTLDKLVTEGKVSRFKLKRKVLFSVDELNNMMEAHRTVGQQPAGA